MNKKILLLFALVVVMALVVWGLSPKNEEDNETQNVVEQAKSEVANNIEKNEVTKMDTIQIKVNEKVLSVKLENNSSVDAFVEKLKDGDIVVNVSDYGNFEKVGDLGFSLPTNDTRITTEPGDLILYQGNQITLYYDTNTWTFTKLGKVEGVSENELRDILGSGNVTLVFSVK